MKYMFKDKPFEFIIFKKKRMHNVWTIDTYFYRGLAFRIMCNLIYYNLYSYLKPIFAILHQKEKKRNKKHAKNVRNLEQVVRGAKTVRDPTVTMLFI